MKTAGKVIRRRTRRQSAHYREAIQFTKETFDFLYRLDRGERNACTPFLNTVDKLAGYYYLIDDNDEALQMADLLLEQSLLGTCILKMKITTAWMLLVAAKVYEQCKTVLIRTECHPDAGNREILPEAEIELLFVTPLLSLINKEIICA